MEHQPTQGHHHKLVAASSEAISNRDRYLKELRSIYFYCYDNNLRCGRAEIDARKLPVLLGHASIGFTLDTYRHLYECERREAALSLDDLLGRPGPPRAVN